MNFSTFGLSHVLAIILGVFLTFLLNKVVSESKKPVVRYTVSAVMGVVVGVLISYFISHILVFFLNRSSVFRRAGEMNYRLTFWSLFVGFSTISIIVGGLLGLFYAKRKERKEKNGHK